jgi:hypothetical protein
MRASAIVYVITRSGSAERVQHDARELRAQDTQFLVVPVIDLTGVSGSADVEQVRELDGECFVARVVDDEAGEAFASVEIGKTELVAVPSAPTAQPSVIYVDPEPGAQSTGHAWAALSSLVRWVESAGLPAWILIGTDPSSGTSLADALAGRHTSFVARDHEALLSEHREQGLLLSDLRLEYDELLQRAIEFEKELQRTAALEAGRDALVAAEERARSELDALLATRTLRYTARLRHIYGSVRSGLRRGR